MGYKLKKDKQLTENSKEWITNNLELLRIVKVGVKMCDIIDVSNNSVIQANVAKSSLWGFIAVGDLKERFFDMTGVTNYSYAKSLITI